MIDDVELQEKIEDALRKHDEFVTLRKEILQLEMRVRALEWDQVIEGED